MLYFIGHCAEGVADNEPLTFVRCTTPQHRGEEKHGFAKLDRIMSFKCSRLFCFCHKSHKVKAFVSTARSKRVVAGKCSDSNDTELPSSILMLKNISI